MFTVHNLPSSCTPDQRRMVEIIGHLTKMRFGDQEQSKAKDTKEVHSCRAVDLQYQYTSCGMSLVVVKFI